MKEMEQGNSKDFELVLIDVDSPMGIRSTSKEAAPELELELDTVEEDPLAMQGEPFSKDEKEDPYLIPEPVSHLEEILPANGQIVNGEYYDIDTIAEFGSLHFPPSSSPVIAVQTGQRNNAQYPLQAGFEMFNGASGNRTLGNRQSTFRTKKHGEKRHACPQCSYATDRACNLRIHIRRHTGEKPFACDMCEYRTCDGGTLSKHRKSHLNKGQKFYKCYACSYSTTIVSDFHSHARTHTEEKNFTCEQCGFESTDLNILNRHKMAHMVGGKTGPLYKTNAIKVEPPNAAVVNNVCIPRDKVTSTTTTRDTTLRKILSADQKFRCYACKYSSGSVQELHQHMQTHIGEKRFACNECDFKSRDELSLNRHKNLHISTRRERTIYTCFDCDYNTVNAADLRKHIRTHTARHIDRIPDNSLEPAVAVTNKEEAPLPHGNLPIELEEDSSGEFDDIPDDDDQLDEYFYDSPGPSNGDVGRRKPIPVTSRIENGERVFICKDCDYQTARACNLRTHIRRHTGEKPFACVECDYRSGDRSSLLRHMKIHTGHRPHACPKCNYRTAYPASLRSHMRVHYEKPFSCDKCSYRTSVQSSLLCHMRIHASLKRPAPVES